MTIKVPKHFTRFKCIAEKCRDNCCIGWKIVIDDELNEKYGNLGGKLGERLKKSIVYDEGTPIFKLDSCGRCPMLNERGLCDIITERGEEYLCEICREHPRYYNVLADYCEGGIGIACEVGAKLVLAADDDEFTEITADFGSYDAEYDEALADTITVRDELLSRCAPNTRFDEQGLLHLAAKLDEKYGFGDDRCEVINPLDAVEALANLTPFNEEFTHDLASAKEVCGRVDELINGGGRVYFMRLLRYFIRRHFINSVDMRNPLATLRMCIASAKAIFAIYLAHTDKKEIDLPLLTECVKNYSKSVEYNTDNTYDLIDLV